MNKKVIAFIPVRGGSKSIPLKNIKIFCGKPLVYWNIKSLQETEGIDQIVIATDSDEIEKTVLGFSFSKVIIYRRNKENASDTASTESVILEYIESSALLDEDVFLLVQATSPLTEEKHFSEALELYKTKPYDSLLTCVRNYRFYWNEDGTAKNYDYKKRPRRQDFNGELMENGAFYINTVGNIKAAKNRLSGAIGIYEMPEYTAFEIDEENDWIVLENLMYKYILGTINPQIKLFLSDVDGVLTDAGMYYSEEGDELKKFNTRDGMGFQLLRESGIKTGIITSEQTEIVNRRAKKLKVDYLYQGKSKNGKLGAALEICAQENISINEVAYIGDDVNCFELLSAVGIKACPNDAVAKVKSIPGIIVLEKNGGEGAVREFVDVLGI